MIQHNQCITSVIVWRHLEPVQIYCWNGTKQLGNDASTAAALECGLQTPREPFRESTRSNNNTKIVFAYSALLKFPLVVPKQWCIRLLVP